MPGKNKKMQSKISGTTKAYMVAILLSAIFGFHFFNNFFWLKLDSIIRGVGTDWHLMEAVKFHISLKQILFCFAGSFGDKLMHAYDVFTAWPNGNSPPLIYCLSSLVDLRHFDLYRVRLYFNAFFLLLLILSTYFLARKIFDRKIGVFAAFLVVFYPLISAYSRQYGPDFPVAAVTALCWALLVYSRKYTSLIYSLLLGLCLGMSCLIKLQVVFFVAGPMIYIFFTALMKNSEKKKIISHFLIVLFLSISIASCYWVRILIPMAQDFLTHLLQLYPGYNGPRIGTVGPREIPVFSSDGFTYYAIQLLNIVSWPLFLVFLLSLTKLIRTKEKAKGFFLWCFFTPLLVFTIISVKFSKFILPLVVPMSIISSWAIMTIRRKWLRRGVLLGIGGYLIGLIFFTSWCGDYREFKNILHAGLEEGVELCRTQEDEYIKNFKRMGAIRFIRARIDRGNVVNIRFVDGAQHSIFTLYCFFQDEIFLNKLDIRQARKKEDLKGADLILFSSAAFSLNSDLMDEYKVMSRIWNGEDEGYVLARSTDLIQFLESASPKGLRGELAGDSIRLQLVDKAWKIFFRGVEITKNLSVYTSMHSVGQWYDSMQYVWDIEEAYADELTAIGFNFSFPIRQIWHFRLEGDRLYWKIKIRVGEFVLLDREQANVMLSSDYSAWIVDNKIGEFPVGFNRDYGGDWDALRTITPRTNASVGVRSVADKLPEVLFYPTSLRKDMQGAVINSDDQFQGRVLQYVAKHGRWHIIFPGEHEYFSGYFLIKDPNAFTEKRPHETP